MGIFPVSSSISMNAIWSGIERGRGQPNQNPNPNNAIKTYLFDIVFVNVISIKIDYYLIVHFMRIIIAFGGV